MSKIFKRIISGIASLALSVSALASSFSMTTFAAGQLNREYTMIQENNPITSSGSSAVWLLELGHHIGNFQYDERFTVFCIEHGKSANRGGGYYKTGSNGWGTWKISDLNKQQLISEICYYGYNSHKNKTYYVATQALIWEVAGNQRNTTTFALTGTGMKSITTNYSNAKNAYEYIERNVLKFRSTPTSNAGTHTLKWNGSKYTCTISKASVGTGAANESNDFKAKVAAKGLTVTESGSNYIISSPTYFAGTKTVDYNRKLAQPFTYDEFQKTRSQSVCIAGGADPRESIIRFNAEQSTGGFTFQKNWQDLDRTSTDVVKKSDIKQLDASARFYITNSSGTTLRFTGSAGNYTYTTSAKGVQQLQLKQDNSGKMTVKGLPVGTYTINEVVAKDGNSNSKGYVKATATNKNYTLYYRPSVKTVTVTAGTVTDYSGSPMGNAVGIQNTRLYAYKYDNNNKPLKGAKYELYVGYIDSKDGKWHGSYVRAPYLVNGSPTVYADSKGVKWEVGTMVRTATSDDTGLVDFGSVPAYWFLTGDKPIVYDYSIKEVSAPTNYALNNKQQYILTGRAAPNANRGNKGAVRTSKDSSLIDYFTFNNTPQNLIINITKVDDENKKLQGAVFGLYANQDNLKLFDLNNKLSSNSYSNEKTYAKDELIAQGKSNSNGEITFGDNMGRITCSDGKVRSLLSGKYYVKEITPPKNYVKNNSKYAFTLKSDKTSTQVTFHYYKTIPNKHKNGEITVIKEGHNKVKLAGAEFKLYPTDTTVTVNGKKYAAGQTIASGETDSNGKLVFPRVPTGYKYTIEETKAPKGYALSSNSKKTFDLDDNDNVASYIKLSRTFTNDAYGEVTVVKNDMNGVALAGAKFAIYTSENDAKNGTNAVATGSTKKNSNGTVSPVTFTKLLPDTHTYWLVELTPPPGFLAKGTVTINDGTAKKITQAKQPIKLIFKNVDGTPTTYAKYSKAVFKNTEQEARIIVNKVGTDGVTSIPLANAEFKITAAEDIYSQNGKLIYTKGTQIKSGIKTDNNGKLVISSDQTDGVGTAKAKLYCGTYTVTETKAPNGYRLPSNPSQDVTITKDDTPTAQFKNKSITFKNSTGVVIRAYKVDKQTGKLIAGAQYGLYAAQDVKSLDGKTVLWKKNAQIATSTITNTKGVAKFYRNGSTKEIAILFGYKYFVKEIKPPENYILDKNWRWDIDLTRYSSTSANLPVIIENNGKDGNADPNFNDWQTGNVIVKKVYNDGTKKPLAGAQFTLYAGEDVLNSAGKIYTLEITNADGTTKSIKLKKDTKIAVSNITGTNGLAKFKDDKGNEIKVPVGFTFYVKETKTPAGFKADPNTKTEFTLDYDVSVDYVKMDAKPLEKDNKPIEVYISKEKLTGKKPLVGAKLAVINTATNETFAEWQSTGTEKLLSQIPAGNYILRETITPDGCVVTTDIKFKVTTDGKVTNVSCLNGNLYEIRVKNDTPLIVMFDEFTKVKISKVEIGTNKELKGAILEIKDKATGKIVKDANGKELKWVSNGEAKEIIGVFIVGHTYILTETAAPEGHIIAKSVEFTIKDRDRTTGKYVVQPVVMEDDYTRVEISKTDITTGKEVKGAKLYIIDSKGNKIAEWITNGTPYRLYRLAKGHYTLYEKLAPTAQGYVRTKKVEFDVDDKSSVVQKVKMEDNYTKLAILKTDKETGKPLAGAVLQLLKADGTIYKEWTTTDKEYRIDYIPIGTYTLHEKTAPAGYVKFKDQTIVINEQDFIDEQSKDPNYIKRVIAKDDIITVEIDKTSITDGKKVIGAHLVIKDSKGKVFAEWNTTEKPHTIKRMPAGEYTLTETYAPNGYVIANTVKFTVKETGEIQKVHMIDDITKLEISKYKANAKTDDDKPLAGAVLKLTDKETGKIVDQWTTNGTPHKIYEKLTAGKTYVLEEISAPAGYVVCKDKKEITISVDGKIDRLSLTDDTTKVELSKKKITGDDELKGAKLQIIDTTTNKVVEEWTSTTKPHYLEAKLIAGRKYILREIAAPDEYALTSDVTFTVSTDGSIDKVDIRDTNLAELPTAGGVGTGIFCIFGIFMMLAAVMLKKRED